MTSGVGGEATGAVVDGGGVVPRSIEAGADAAARNQIGSGSVGHGRFKSLAIATQNTAVLKW